MLSPTILFLAAITQASPAHTPPQRAVSACPARYWDMPLLSGMVLDGPPEENAILKPADGDDDKAVWLGLAHVYQVGRKVWLACSYVDDAFIYMPVERPVKVCRFVKRRTLVRLYCR